MDRNTHRLVAALVEKIGGHVTLTADELIRADGLELTQEHSADGLRIEIRTREPMEIEGTCVEIRQAR
jgi:hypothetical protein